MGRYRFVIDLDGHIHDERVADALIGLRRFSPKVIFLGSYPRANGHRPEVSSRYQDAAFVDARAWLEAVAEGQPDLP
jgi:prephenate dehydratase